MRSAVIVRTVTSSVEPPTPNMAAVTNTSCLVLELCFTFSRKCIHVLQWSNIFTCFRTEWYLSNIKLMHETYQQPNTTSRPKKKVTCEAMDKNTHYVLLHQECMPTVLRISRSPAHWAVSLESLTVSSQRPPAIFLHLAITQPTCPSKESALQNCFEKAALFLSTSLGEVIFSLFFLGGVPKNYY